jgi:hypothetical protein
MLFMSIILQDKNKATLINNCNFLTWAVHYRAVHYIYA